MANRNWASGGKMYSMHVMPVMIDCQITIGAAGAVASIVGPLISSVTRISIGLYQLNMSNNFNRMISAHASAQSPSVGLSGILGIEIQNAPNASVSSLSAPTLRIKTLDAAGALANPASGSVIDVMAIMSNSSITIQGD